MTSGSGRRSPDAPAAPAAGGDWLHAGRVGRPHGLDGSFHVTRPQPALLAEGVTLTVDGRPERVVRVAGTDARPIVRLASCTSRTAAEALRGRDLLLARADAPPLEEDEWWPEELEGCRVHDGERTVGVVRGLLALPSCEVLEVAREGGGDDLLVPLIRDAVRAVDVAERRIEIDVEFLGETAPPNLAAPTDPPAAPPDLAAPTDPPAAPADPPAAPADPGPAPGDRSAAPAAPTDSPAASTDPCTAPDDRSAES